MVCNHPLNCQNPMVRKGRWLPFPRLEASPCLWGSLLVADKWNPNHSGKDAVSTILLVSLLLARAFAPNLCDWIPEFQFMITTVMSMAAKSSNLDDRMSGANLQTKTTCPYHQEAERTLNRWEHQAVPPPTCHLGLWPGSHCLFTLIPGTV